MFHISFKASSFSTSYRTSHQASVSKCHTIMHSFRTMHTESPLPTKCFKTFKYHEGAIVSLTTLPDGRLASGSSGVRPCVKVKDLYSDAPPKTLSRPANALSISGLSLPPNNWLLTAGSEDGILYLWSPDTGNEMGRLGGIESSQPITSLTTFFDKKKNKGFILSGSLDRQILAWDPSNVSPYHCAYGIGSHSAGVNALALFTYKDPQAAEAITALASGGNDEMIYIWDPRQFGGLLNNFSHGKAVRCLSVLPDQKTLVSGSDDKSIGVWDPTNKSFPLKNWIYQKSNQRPFAEVYSIAAFANGMIASGHLDGEINLWNPWKEDGYLYTLPERHLQCVNALTVLRDQSLVSGSRDKSIKWWTA